MWKSDAINYYEFYKLLQRRKYDKMGEYLYLMQCYSAKTIEKPKSHCTPYYWAPKKRKI